MPNGRSQVTMEHVPIFTLLILTLLQVCWAELPVLPGPWYSANVITDGDFSPKPISEIFTSQSTSPFSPTNPIVVLPTSSPKSSSSITTAFPTDYSSSFSTSDFMSSYTTAATPDRFDSTTPSMMPPQFGFGAKPGTSNQYTFDMQQPGSTQQNNPPNYFVFYQQAPQNVPNFPTGPQQMQNTFPSSTLQPTVSTQSTFFTTVPEISTPQMTFSTMQSTFSTPQSTFSSPQSTFSTTPSSTFSTGQPTFSTGQSTFSTGQSTFSTPLSTFSTAQPSVSTSQSTFSTPQSTLSTGSFSSFQPSSDSTFPSNLPSQPSSTPSPLGPSGLPCATASPVRPTFPSLRIRVLAPSGSITNVNVLNPRTTTRRTTTTRRPTTTRTRRTRRNRNSYDGCINACNGRRAPICTSPLAQTPIDPSTLKGFPSVCHMACHNSFRTNQYEMIVEGKCGRLRNRIRTMDSSKLTRTELNKAQYTVVGNDPQTVVEFSSLPRK